MWVRVARGRAIGYRRPGAEAGTWYARIFREKTGNGSPYIRHALGTADDVTDADGEGILSYGQAVEQVVVLDPHEVDEPDDAREPLTVRRAVERCQTRFQVNGGRLLTCDPLGHRPLREAISDYLATSRGARCEPEQVVVVSGVQEALDLVARLFLDTGERVAVEEPGYSGATRLFEASGATVVPLPVDRDGAVVDESQLAGARLAYLTPAHQYPLGFAMGLSRRLAWLEWAVSHDALLFEDDSDSEYRYSGRPLPALQGLDRCGQVLLAGSFSKVLFPALRLGYLVVPEDLLDRFAAIQSVTRRHAPLLEQAILADFMAEGHFGRHIRRMREVYAGRLEVLLSAAAEDLAGLVEISDVEAGLQTVGWLRPGISSQRAATAAHRRGLEVQPLGRWSGDDRGREALHLGFAAVDEAELRRGVRELADALRAEEGVS